MKYQIAELIEITDGHAFLKAMQESFAQTVGSQRTFRVTATPLHLGTAFAELENEALVRLLKDPPRARRSGWTVKPLGSLRRNALGFENERPDYHHMIFIKNGHLEFWTEIDDSFCWQQPEQDMQKHPRLYPYAVVEYPVSFARLYRGLVELIGLSGNVIFQMQFVNVKGAILLPYQPGSIGFDHPHEPVKPLARDSLIFEKKMVGHDFDPDPVALSMIKDLYFEFGYERKHIPFFDDKDQCRL